MRYYWADPHILTEHEARLRFDPRSAIIAGLDAWADLNPRLVFIRTPRKSRLAIRCKTLIRGCGKASMGTFPGGAIWLDLEQLDTYDAIRDTVAHEFGHICGYPHTRRMTDHLMYGEGYYDKMVAKTSDGRKARQFKIPKPLHPHTEYDPDEYWDDHGRGPGQ